MIVLVVVPVQAWHRPPRLSAAPSAGRGGTHHGEEQLWP
jgi:hypothetical protein